MTRFARLVRFSIPSPTGIGGAPRRPLRAGPRLRNALFVLLLTLPPTLLAAAELENRLATSASPYLQMHADDPIHWQAWNEETLTLAAELDRPLYLSSGFYACRWCHVMQRKSFRDPAIAEHLNRHFVPVKIDREVDPATDERLIAFLRTTIGAAGWPLNVMVTPEGRPFHGFLYQPRDTFEASLTEVADRWRREADAVREDARTLDRAASEQPEPQPLSTSELHQRLIDATLTEADDFEGGFGQGRKFPHSPRLQALLVLYGTHPRLDEWLELTLEHIAGRGLRDHIGGGFFRYTVDPGWEEPHFEKMLYDNAQLARLYLAAAPVMDEPRWRAVGRETLDFILDAMARPEGGYLSALSAEDGAGRDGGYYLWTPVQLSRALDDELLPVVVRYYGMERPPLFDHGHLPVPRRSRAEVAADRELDEAVVAERLKRGRTALREARQARERPADGKAVAAWNGLLLSALAPLADEPRYREAGDALAAFLGEEMMTGDALLRALGPDNEPLGRGGLADYTLVARGLLDWAAATEAAEPRRRAIRLAEAAWNRFRDAGGWHSEKNALLRYGDAVVLPEDGDLPAATAALLEVATALADDVPSWSDRADTLSTTIQSFAGHAPLAHGSHIVSLSRP